ncbi:putative pectinesterase/pectinesterase inhibitor 22 [Senna tora]|uniref:Pectinesterase n=1 Tax=Senna tora TaxID=362788 RepID=A0A834SLY3_9FABA|nr:putative pectinesterase/pectinesterase inhibitor 22 [Senna tora]
MSFLLASLAMASAASLPQHGTQRIYGHSCSSALSMRKVERNGTKINAENVYMLSLRDSLIIIRCAIQVETRLTGLCLCYRKALGWEGANDMLGRLTKAQPKELLHKPKLWMASGEFEPSPPMKANDLVKKWNAMLSDGMLYILLHVELANQSDCLINSRGANMDIYRETVSKTKKQLVPLLSQVTALIAQARAKPGIRRKPGSVAKCSTKQPRHVTSSSSSSSVVIPVPEWMTEADQELLKSRPRADAVVALDGSGHYRSITEAVNAAPSMSRRRYVIYVKKGIYKENVDMKRKKTNIMFVGDGIGKTIITGNRNFMQGWTTFRTATLAVSGKGFIARDMSFRNTAGPENHQAVALRVDSDQSAFYRCSIEGHQDTLYAHSLRQFYRECEIYGTIDFIFGNGAAVLQNCKIYTRVPLPLQKVTITAQGRKSPHQSTGFTIQDSFVLATQPTYLGRPWKQYSRTVYINTYMSGLVQPRGWLEWFGNFALNTLWYGEYRNYGPGAAVGGRVKWPGYHIIKDAAVANYFTVQRFIDGGAWLPATGVRFTAGLTN